MLLRSSTEDWLARALSNPLGPDRLRPPETLQFSAQAPTFRAVYEQAPAGTELGFPMILRGGHLDLLNELTAQARYKPLLDGGQFVGGFHVHPAAGGAAPFFDPADIAAALRSDNAGILELLLAGDRLFALVRTNPTLYISSHHVNRNPMLLAEDHLRMIRSRGVSSPSDPAYSAAYRAASLYYFHQYDLALYEGEPDYPLKRTVTPNRSL